jgi:uncharacterized protein
MMFMFIWEKLFRYQQLEKKLEELKKDKKLKEQYLGLKEEKVRLEKKIEEFQQAKASNLAIDKLIKKLEQEIDKISTMAKEQEKRLYSGEITNNHELILAKEHFDKFQVPINELEGKLYNLMEEKEAKNTEIQLFIAEIKREKEEFDVKHGAFQEEKSQKTEQQTTLEQEGKILLEELEKANRVIDIYKQLKTRFADPIAKLNNGICSGCRIGVSYETLKLLGSSKGGEPIRCSNCERVIIQ